MSVVNGKDVTLLFYKDGKYDGVACNASCSLNIGTDMLETTFLGSGKYRHYLPSKHSIEVTGNGPIFLGKGVTVSDIIKWQLDRQSVSFHFELNNGVDAVGISGIGYISQSALEGTAGQLANGDYTIKVSGELSFYEIEGSGTGVNQVFDITADGEETIIADSELIGKDVVFVSREGIGIEVITSGTPNGSQVAYDSGSGSLTFGTVLSPGEWVHVIYN